MTNTPNGYDAEVVARLEAAYAKVAEWPEKRMPGVDITTLGEGFSDLLHLRNLIPEAVSSLVALSAERDSWRRVAERCKSEAEGHAMEARTANSTIYEIYQVLSGATGEPGNWHGAEPARKYVAAAEAKVERMEKALGCMPCPRPANHRPDQFDAKDCIAAGEGGVDG